VNDHEIRTIFVEGVESLGLSLSPVQFTQYRSYLSELIRWNQKINLTGLRDTKKIIVKNFLDAMTPLCHVKPEENAHWMDVGSGGGFPGLVLKIACPQLKMTLVEPTRKKVSFLHHVVGLLGLQNVFVRDLRIGQLASCEATRFDLLLSRALAPETVLKQALPLIPVGGRLLFFQARYDVSWWRARLAPYPGLVLERPYITRLPFLGDTRSLILIRVSGREDH